MIAGVVIGLPYGPRGVAIAYSAVTLIRVVPVTAWALHGTGIRIREIVVALARPLAASLVAASISYAGHTLYGPTLPSLLRLALDIGVFGAIYIAALLLIAGKQALHLDIFRAARAVPTV
jgi:PST family polysaccharide transporter